MLLSNIHIHTYHIDHQNIFHTEAITHYYHECNNLPNYHISHTKTRHSHRLMWLQCNSILCKCMWYQTCYLLPVLPGPLQTDNTPKTRFGLKISKSLQFWDNSIIPTELPNIASWHKWCMYMFNLNKNMKIKIHHPILIIQAYFT